MAPWRWQIENPYRSTLRGPKPEGKGWLVGRIDKLSDFVSAIVMEGKDLESHDAAYQELTKSVTPSIIRQVLDPGKIVYEVPSGHDGGRRIPD